MLVLNPLTFVAAGLFHVDARAQQRWLTW